MILVADSGSTKTDWAVIVDGITRTYFSTSGYNPFFMDADSIRDSIFREIDGRLDSTVIRQVFFYGAGCQGAHIATMEYVLQQVFTAAETVKVEVDLLAAARALLGNEPGFAAILGTGTNTCLYDGNAITYHIDSLGFLLGDEGSGAVIGKRILTDYLRNQMGQSVREAFIRIYALDENELMQEVYGAGYPNRYCASFVKFLDEPTVSADYRRLVVCEAFSGFFEKLVCLYPDYRSLTFNCVGSVGYHFSDLLRVAAEDQGMKVGRVLPSVIESLSLHHSEMAQGDFL